jgi:hypothetical protein
MSARITEAMIEAAANILAQADGYQCVFAKHYDLANMVLEAALSTEPGVADGWQPIDEQCAKVEALLEPHIKWDDAVKKEIDASADRLARALSTQVGERE